MASLQVGRRLQEADARTGLVSTRQGLQLPTGADVPLDHRWCAMHA